MKKSCAVLAAVCLLSACSGGETVSETATAEDGKPALYELPEGERFLYDGDRVFISFDCSSDEYKKLLDTLYETRNDPESFRTIGWVDGELKIISGYGAENT